MRASESRGSPPRSSRRRRGGRTGPSRGSGARRGRPRTPPLRRWSHRAPPPKASPAPRAPRRRDRHAGRLGLRHRLCWRMARQAPSTPPGPSAPVALLVGQAAHEAAVPSLGRRPDRRPRPAYAACRRAEPCAPPCPCSTAPHATRRRSTQQPDAHASASPPSAAATTVTQHLASSSAAREARAPRAPACSAPAPPPHPSGSNDSV